MRAIVTDADTRFTPGRSAHKLLGAEPPGAPPDAGAAPTDSQPGKLRADAYSDRLLKYVPAEVIALYLALEAIVRGHTGAAGIEWVALAAGVVGTPLYLYRKGHVTRRTQLVISTLAFLVWVLAIGGPFSNMSWYSPAYGAVLLIIFTFFVPLIEP